MPFMIPTAEYLSADEATEYEAGEDAGFYARLSAPGYLDCTEWNGPYPRAWMALRAVCEEYDVRTDGEDREKRCTATADDLVSRGWMEER